MGRGLGDESAQAWGSLRWGHEDRSPTAAAAAASLPPLSPSPTLPPAQSLQAREREKERGGRCLGGGFEGEGRCGTPGKWTSRAR